MGRRLSFLKVDQRFVPFTGRCLDTLHRDLPDLIEMGELGLLLKHLEASFVVR
jgi:hypothetical protein